MTARKQAKKSSPQAVKQPKQREGTPKIQRWIDLLAALLRRKYPATFEELAREVPAYADSRQARDARTRMFERDKDELRAFGVPIESVELDVDVHGYRLASADFYLPYLVATTSARTGKPRKVDSFGYRALATLAFEPEELAAVAESAARVRALGDPMLSADAESAIRKLAFDLPMAASMPSDAPVLARNRDPVDPVVYERLGDALLRQKQVAFQYQSMESDSSSERTVEPYGLFFLGSHWYLAGRDLKREAVRNLRVSRISVVRVNPRRAQTRDYEVPSSFSLREHARSRQAWELGDGDIEDVVVVLLRDSGAARAAAQLGETVAGEPHKRLFKVRRSDVFCRWLLSLAGDARAVSPNSVVERFHQMVAETSAVYARDER
ncbi:MAG: WYL domain-containing protein [Gemmatimonadaceae bacterium]|nr:WYL domain-containing protein [Gemmatimonadaceae bacterium]MDQ3519240.1 WYL domain-containing protein [Gemmatimonadota bacterium]